MRYSAEELKNERSRFLHRFNKHLFEYVCNDVPTPVMIQDFDLDEKEDC